VIIVPLHGGSTYINLTVRVGLGINVGINPYFSGRHSSSKHCEEMIPFLHEIPKRI
jgi:hypothetical protein